jgi:hypothetical protein
MVKSEAKRLINTNILGRTGVSSSLAIELVKIASGDLDLAIPPASHGPSCDSLQADPLVHRPVGSSIEAGRRASAECGVPAEVPASAARGAGRWSERCRAAERAARRRSARAVRWWSLRAAWVAERRAVRAAERASYAVADRRAARAAELVSYTAADQASCARAAEHARP